MTKDNKKSSKNKSTKFKTIRRAFPYVVFCAAIIAVAFFGSQSKFEEQDTDIDMRTIAKNNFSASADQTAELYIVSEVANAMNVSTAAVLAVNYDSITSASAIVANGGTDKIDKPSVVDTSHLAVGVVVYTVQPGESIASIAEKYSASGVTDVMIRWSNGFKASRQVKPGDVIYVPGRAGFVYTVKKGETVNSIATKYQSSIEEIIIANNLELSSELSTGMKILIPDGNLPENERPDYVAPVATRTGRGTYSYSAQYSAGNRYAYGWCTWYAWSKRPDLPSNMGNARNWGNAARRAGFPVDGSPRAGDVFVTGAGTFGHVGYVTSVNSNGTINFCDMNGVAGWGRVGCSTDSASKYTYIHHK